ncbi:MAG TPA: hypothetical protein VF599_03865 [Pyrinomonadaceae bacterium]
MHEDKLNSQIPILRFLNKHKWRITIPILFCVVYFGVPRLFQRFVSTQCDLFITSARNAPAEQLNKEVLEAFHQINNDEYLLGLVVKYDLLADLRKSGSEEKILIEKIRKRIQITPEVKNTANDAAVVYIWTTFWDEDPQKVMALSGEIASRFEAQPNLQVMKYIPPANDTSFRTDVALLGAMPAGVAFSLLLILIWEIPFLFYSQKTKETVFNPLKLDWQSELLEAKLRNQTREAIQINIRYSCAYLAALLQKSPLGDLLEYIGKFAR